jgi:DNA-binding transcriptional LysR family regulator
MEWQQLEYFQTVAKLQHFTRAAELLSISQPTLSRSIANLEAELGVPLFDRQGRNVWLNRYGIRFAKRVERVLKEMEEGREELARLIDPDCGTIALSFLKSLGVSTVPNLLSEFLKMWPNIGFQLYQQSTRDMLDQLERGEVDFVLSSMTEDRNTIEWSCVWQEEIFAYVPIGHRLAHRQEINLSELVGEPFIVLKKGYGTRTITDQLFEQVNAAPNIMFEGEEVVTLVGFVAAGLGVSLLPLIPNLNLDKVTLLRISNPGSLRKIGLAWKSDTYLSPAAERFKHFMLTRFQDGGEEDEADGQS